MKNLIIGLGNTGTQIIKAVMKSSMLNEDKVQLYAIDSVTSSADAETVNRVTVIPIQSDEKQGSGRSRERGAEMYQIHEDDGDFAQMYQDAIDAKSPVLVITSSAGGTGSGSAAPLCRALVARGVKVIPIIITPDLSEPDAYHLNTNDLFSELAEIEDGDGEPGVPSYTIFQNPKDTVNYDPVNQDVVNLIEIILGVRNDYTTRDSIDESDLDTILRTPGRFIATSAIATNPDQLRKLITSKVFSSYQPAWSEEEIKPLTLMTGYSLKSMFAESDFDSVFEDIRKRIVHRYDEYRNVVNSDNQGQCEATVIIAGLPRPAIKNIDVEYNMANDLGAGIKKSTRPSFLGKKKPVSGKPFAVKKKPEDLGTVAGRKLEE